MSDGGVMVLGKVGKDKEEPLHLPPIHQPSRPPSSCPSRRTSSARVQYTAKPQYEQPTRRTDRARSLLDIHEESLDSDDDVPSSTATEAEQSPLHENCKSFRESSKPHSEDSKSLNENSKSLNENSKSPNEKSKSLNENSKSLNENSKSLNEKCRSLNEKSRSLNNNVVSFSANGQFHTTHAPAAGRGQLLASRADQRGREGSVSPCILPRRPHLLRKIDSHTALPARHPPYLKSLSQRDFRGGYNDDDDDDELPAIFQGSCPPHGGLGSRSLSVSSFLPKILPPKNHLYSKSISQPDVFQHSCQGTSASHPTHSSKERVQKLWQRAGRMLNLSQKDDLSQNTTPKPAVSWVPAPGGGFLRPLYSRWPLRRDALAEPERMCMPQPVRERILRDVEVRRRSLKCRVSQFLTVKLGVNTEEDLVA